MADYCVKYKIFNDLTNPQNPIYTSIDDRCFYQLCDISAAGDKGGVEYYIDINKDLSTRIVKWYHKNLNSIGLKSELVIEKERYVFRLKKEDENKMLAILTALRYLGKDVDNFPKIINWCYNYSKKFPRIKFFTLFQLMHHTKNFNAGHALISSARKSNIYYRTPFLVNYLDFKKRLKNRISRVHDLFKTEKNLSENEKTIVSRMIDNDEINAVIDFLGGEEKLELDELNDFGLIATFLGNF